MHSDTLAKVFLALEILRSTRRKFAVRGYWRTPVCRTQSARLSESVGDGSCSYWGSPGCPWRWRTERPQEPVGRGKIYLRVTPQRVTKSLSMRRKFLTSVWRRSMSSTRKIPDHHRSSENQGWPPEAVAAVAVVASAVPTGRNLRNLQRQRRRHSIERRSLRTARTKWRPAQPPQSSFVRQAYNDRFTL